VQHDHRVEQRVAAHVPVGPDRLHDPLERRLVVRDRVQHGLFHAGQQLRERPRAVHSGPQHEGVGEEADDVLQLGSVAAGEHRAHRDVVLARVPGQ